MQIAEPNSYAENETVKVEAAIMLGLLTAVEENAAVTQRSVAKDLGIALGLANAYVKRCVKKGLIKAQQVPANRYAYYLTPKGFAEKSRLTAEYLSQGFHLFRVARQEFDAIYLNCERQGMRVIALHGLTDLTEIAVMASRDNAITISAIVEESATSTSHANIPVVRSLENLNQVDAILITDMREAQIRYETVARVWPRDRILVPKFLNVSRNIAGQERG